MARKNLFGRLRDTVKKTVTRIFGIQFKSDNEEVSRLTPEDTEYTPQPSKPPFPESDSESTSYTDYDYASRERERQLDRIREQYSDLISEANQRWELIKSQGLESMAIDRAQNETGRDYFSLDFALTENDIITEVTRARVFIADQTSTLEGARLYTAEINSEEFRGKFGSKYRTPEYGNKGFDTSVIDEEYAKEVFRSYRMLEEERQDLIKSYGSENLIIAMYDARVRGNDPFLAGLDLIDAWYATKTKTWNDRFDEAVHRYNADRYSPHGSVYDYVTGDVNNTEWGGDHSDELYF